MKKIWIVALCLILVLGMAACGKQPDTSEPTGTEDVPIVDAIPNDGTDASGTEDDPIIDSGNVVDADVFFGGESTTAPSAPTGSAPSTPAGSDAPTSADTTAPTKPTTTVAPPQQEEVQDVAVPAAGYDMDGKGRIQVKKSEVKKENGKQYALITFANVSKDNGREWIIPEYSKVKYACYDKSGAELSTGDAILGALEYGDAITCRIELPKGTVELKIIGHNMEYWTPWA